jgi:hypothetical protein
MQLRSLADVQKGAILRNRARRLIIICSLMILASCTELSHRNSFDPRDVITWLPSDTETIMATNGPFWMSDFGLNDSEHNREISKNEMEKFFQARILMDFSVVANAFNSEQVTLAVKGARHFRSPKSLGLMPYEGCEIAIFGKSQAGQFDKFLREISTQSPNIEKIHQQNVVVIRKQMESDWWTFYVANPLSNVVVVATNREYLQDVLSRMSGKVGLRALPETLPEW